MMFYRGSAIAVTSLCLLAATCIQSVMAQQASPGQRLTPELLGKMLSHHPGRRESLALASEIRSWFGSRNLTDGGNPKVSDLDAAWAVETAGARSPRVVSDDGKFSLPLKNLRGTNVYAAVAHLPEGAAMRWHYDIDGKALRSGQLEVYTTPPDMKAQAGVPQGTLTQQPAWKSQIFPGTTRDWWVYVPAQYRAATPAAVMVFQDGGSYKNFTPTVFDNLIAKGEMPVTVGIFINPGTFADGRSDRSFEYDTLSNQYSRFILEEILPEVEKTVKLRQDPAGRAIGGASSGGICAWTVAWQRPDQFSKVLSWVGSFTNIASGLSGDAGGHNYEALIRKTPPKPIRIFLQDGENDLDNANGNWPLAAQQMAKALAFSKYDYRFAYGHGFHSDRMGRALMPDALVWLWRP